MNGVMNAVVQPEAAERIVGVNGLASEKRAVDAEGRAAPLAHALDIVIWNREFLDSTWSPSVELARRASRVGEVAFGLRGRVSVDGRR